MNKCIKKIVILHAACHNNMVGRRCHHDDYDGDDDVCSLSFILTACYYSASSYRYNLHAVISITFIRLLAAFSASIIICTVYVRV